MHRVPAWQVSRPGISVLTWWCTVIVATCHSHSVTVWLVNTHVPQRQASQMKPLHMSMHQAHNIQHIRMPPAAASLAMTGMHTSALPTTETAHNMRTPTHDGAVMAPKNAAATPAICCRLSPRFVITDPMYNNCRFTSTSHTVQRVMTLQVEAICQLYSQSGWH